MMTEKNLSDLLPWRFIEVWNVDFERDKILMSKHWVNKFAEAFLLKVNYYNDGEDQYPLMSQRQKSTINDNP